MGPNRPVKLKKLRQKGHAYYFDAGGKPRRWIALGSDVVEAMRRYKVLIADKAPSGTVSEILRAHVLAVAGTVAPSSLVQYRSWAKHVEAVCGDVQADTVTQADILQYLDLCPRTSGPGEIGLLSAAYRRAMRGGRLVFNPCVGARSDRPKPKRTRYITDAELHAIIGNATPLLAIAIELAYCTALRVSDLLKLRWDDFVDGGVVATKKTGQRQRFTVDENMQALLDRARALQTKVASVNVLATRRGQPLNQKTVWRWWTDTCKLAGVEGAVWHDLRAKAGTDADALGRDATALLGHSDQATTRVYLRGLKINTIEPMKRRKM